MYSHVRKIVQANLLATKSSSGYSPSTDGHVIHDHTESDAVDDLGP